MPSTIILSDNGATSGSAGLKTSGGNDGVLILQTTTSGGTATNAVYVDTSQLVGLGTTPAAKLHLLTTGNTTADGVRLTLGSEGRSHNIYSALPTGRDLTIAPWRALTINTGSGTNEGVLTLNAYEYTVFGAGSSYTERMRLDASGNLGLGVTPSALYWPNGSTGGLQLQSGALLSAYNATTYLSNNWYYNGGEKYIANGYATRYEQTTGKHVWYTAGNNSSGAGATVSWTQAMTLDANGTLSTVSSSSNAANFQYSGAWTSGNANFVTMYMPNMSGGTAGLALGRAGGTYNTSKIIFGYAGSNSTSNYLGLGFWDADSRLTIYPTGNATLTGSLTQNTSDSRLKTNIQPITNALLKVCSLNGFTHNWNDLAFELNHFNKEVREVGVFAQEVQAVLPEAVFIAPFDQEKGSPSVSASGKNYLTVQYEKLTPLLIEAIKELKAEVDALKGQA